MVRRRYGASPSELGAAAASARRMHPTSAPASNRPAWASYPISAFLDPDWIGLSWHDHKKREEAPCQSSTATG